MDGVFRLPQYCLRRLANGLALAPELLVELDKLAAELKIKPLNGR